MGAVREKEITKREYWGEKNLILPMNRLPLLLRTSRFFILMESHINWKKGI